MFQRPIGTSYCNILTVLWLRGLHSACLTSLLWHCRNICPSLLRGGTKPCLMLPLRHLHCRLTSISEKLRGSRVTPENCFLGTRQSQPLKQQLEQKRQIVILTRPPCRWPSPSPAPSLSPSLKARGANCFRSLAFDK